MMMSWVSKTIRAVIYARVSHDTQDIANSIEAQLDHCRKFIAQQGWVEAGVYLDEAKSGRYSDRPGFQKMAADAGQKDHSFDVIVVWKLNRFARNKRDSVIYKELLRSHGVEVVSINEPNDGSPAGNLLVNIMEAVDAFFSENMGQDVRRGMAQVASRGFYLPHAAPYGYDLVKVQDGQKMRNRLATNPAKAAVVQRMFDLRDAGDSTQDIGSPGP